MKRLLVLTLLSLLLVGCSKEVINSKVNDILGEESTTTKIVNPVSSFEGLERRNFDYDHLEYRITYPILPEGIRKTDYAIKTEDFSILVGVLWELGASQLDAPADTLFLDELLPHKLVDTISFFSSQGLRLKGEEYKRPLKIAEDGLVVKDVDYVTVNDIEFMCASGTVTYEMYDESLGLITSNFYAYFGHPNFEISQRVAARIFETSKNTFFTFMVEHNDIPLGQAEKELLDDIMSTFRRIE